MSISKSVFYAFLSAFLLLVVAGSAFTGFQNWIETHSLQSKSVENQPVVSSGIRSISSVKQAETPEREQQDEAVKNLTEVAKPKLAAPLAQIDTNSDWTQTEGSSEDKISNVQPNSVIEPSVVMFEDEMVVEFPAAIANETVIKRVLTRLILSPHPFKESLLRQGSLSFRETPYFYKKVIDDRGDAIRYPAKAFSYVDQLLKTDSLQKIEDEEGQFVVVHIPLVKPNYPKPVERYKQWVDNYAAEFSVSPALVFAIMETESGFKADAVSRSQAMGLMQLKAAAAGKDVFQYVDAKQGQPSKRELFDEQKNIRMGTAYLGLLKHDYLSEIRNQKNKELLAIASYNGGLSTVLKLFGASNQQALEQINRLHPRQVYRKLRFEHQSKETREYIDKVLKAKNRYQAILNA